MRPLYLAGQTGSGKTAVALAVAERIEGVEIVNADAFQVYRGVEILSAAPTAEEKSRVPHHLFGILGPEEDCDAASFAERARETISGIRERGSLPLVVGGSGLYLKAITHGLAPTPPADPALRAELENCPLEELVERYRTLDPTGAEATNLKNRRYVTRNLEICLLSGRPASEIKNRWRESTPDLDAFWLRREREDLHRRIRRRTDAMFADGVVGEVERLGELSETAGKAIGIREIRALLAGEIDEAACRERIATITRRYAKRQGTWFRRENAFRPVDVGTDDSAGDIAERIHAERIHAERIHAERIHAERIHGAPGTDDARLLP